MSKKYKKLTCYFTYIYIIRKYNYASYFHHIWWLLSLFFENIIFCVMSINKNLIEQTQFYMKSSLCYA